MMMLVFCCLSACLSYHKYSLWLNLLARCRQLPCLPHESTENQSPCCGASISHPCSSLWWAVLRDWCSWSRVGFSASSGCRLFMFWFWQGLWSPGIPAQSFCSHWCLLFQSECRWKLMQTSCLIVEILSGRITSAMAKLPGATTKGWVLSSGGTFWSFLLATVILQEACVLVLCKV